MSGAQDQFARCLAFTIGPGPKAAGQEGGYSNDPNDPGGATNFGVTLAAWAEWEQRPVTPEEIRNLTRPQVVPFYAGRYWNALRCWALGPGVDVMNFDFGVNAGVGASARLLQQAVGVTVDGIVGPITALAARGMGAAPLITALHASHTAYYRSLAEFSLYGTDWLRRTDECRDVAMAMLTPTP